MNTETKTKWTAGPWKFAFPSGHIYSDLGSHIACMSRNHFPFEKETEANAQLIALAPELAEVLAEIVDHATRYGAAPLSAEKMFDRARALLAKLPK